MSRSALWDKGGFRRDDPANPALRDRRPRARKDTKRWCRGKQGVPHVEVVVRESWNGTRDTACTDDPARLPGWIPCYHRVRCGECGKVLRYLNAASCPDRVGRAS